MANMDAATSNGTLDMEAAALNDSPYVLAALSDSSSSSDNDFDFESVSNNEEGDLPKVDSNCSNGIDGNGNIVAHNGLCVLLCLCV